MLLFLLLIIIILYLKIIDKKAYDKSQYKKESGVSYLKAKFDTGFHGEYLTFRKLEKMPGYFKILTNVYIPKEDGTTEIDLIFIHETEIYVLESKNHGGWIFGSENNKSWTQTFKNGRKERLGLEISSEKSKAINLRKKYSSFLGSKLKVISI